MPISQPTFKPSDVTVTLANNPLITNLSIPIINTEVSHALQNGLRKLMVKSRSHAILKLSFFSGESATKYITLKPANVLVVDEIDFLSKSIYVQSDTVTTLEILELYTT